MATTNLNEKLLEALRAIRSKSDEIPHGWFCRTQFEELVGISRSCAAEKLSQMLKAGLLEFRKFRVAGPVVTTMVPHYRLRK